MLEFKRGVENHQKITMPLRKSVRIDCILNIMHGSGLPLSNRLKLQKYDTTHRLVGGLKRAPRNQLHPSAPPAQEWESLKKASRGRLHTAHRSGSSHRAVCGNSSPQDVTTIRSLQDSRGDRTRNLLRVTNCTETCLVQEVSELETGTVLWGNGVIFWALILDLPSNVILRE